VTGGGRTKTDAFTSPRSGLVAGKQIVFDRSRENSDIVPIDLPK
jgi:hypothetical protein